VKSLKFHAQALDEIGSLYYTKESFDDYYAGKGSTYPDLNGSIGILYEQASSRGHLHQTNHGLLDFAYTIRNQAVTIFSTMRAAHHLKSDLRNYQRNFFNENQNLAARDNVKGFVIEKPADQQRWHYFLDILLMHNIEVYELNSDITAGESTFKAGNAALVPLNQPQYRFIKSLFDRPDSFMDSIFYDLSTWNMPDAFHLSYESVTRPFQPNWQGEKIVNTTMPEGSVIGGETNYAYALPWTFFHSPGALYAMQQLGIKTKIATRTFESIPARTNVTFEPGTVLIPVQANLDKFNVHNLHAVMLGIAREFGVNIYAISTGMNVSGVDIGSPAMGSIEIPSIALITGGGVYSNEIGEIWHLLDQRHRIPVALIDAANISGSNLADFNVIIMADGSYTFSEAITEEIQRWVRNGGTLILQKRAVRWAVGAKLVNLKYKSQETEAQPVGLYANINAQRARNVLGGAIFTVEADLTNPLMYGLEKSPFPVHRGTAAFIEFTGNSYATVAKHGESSFSSGYISYENLEMIKNSAYLTAHAQGRGRIICFADNPNFRGYWFGTNRLTMNAIFMSQVLSGLSLER
jgi:hypothetical protein